MKPLLLIIATDITYPQGGLKHMDNLGANGETIVDYTLYDATRAGFGKIVMVVSKDFDENSKTTFEQRYAEKTTIDFIIYNHTTNKKSIDNTELNKILAAENYINQPFAVITAGNFYGSESYKIMANYLRSVSDKKHQYAMISYTLGNTFLDAEIVSRDLCEINEHSCLIAIQPQEEIELGETIVYQDEHGHRVEVPENTPVSMGFWGFTPDFFGKIQTALNNPAKNKTVPNLSILINTLLNQNEISVNALKTKSKWMTIMSANDKLMAVLKINEMVKKGEYPAKL